jgi:glycosyltransferase involved in cell wall biosynthesis
MNNNPKISVIMSVHNGETYLRESVESILDQTYRDFEFLIVDDGSVDRTGEILASYKDRRIKIITQRNQGLTPSLNKAIQLARGEYIARQDADDRSSLHRLEREFEFMQVHTDVSLVGTHVSFINKDGKEFGSWKPPESHGEIRKCLLEEGNAFCHGSVMIRKACLEDVGFYREAFEYTQDYDLWLRISEKYRVENIPDIFYQFRRGPKTISRKKLSRQLDFHLLAVALAKERERNGRDSLDEISTKNIEDKILDQREKRLNGS